MDVARTALRKGVESVSIFSRRGPEHLACSRLEREYAEVDGAEFEFFRQPVEITEDGIVFRNTEQYEDGEGKTRVRGVPGSERLYPATSVIVAISQGPRAYIVSTTHGLEVDKKGLLVTDGEGHTTREGVFASGDVVSGARTVVEAVNYSKKVAGQIVEYVEALKEKREG